MVGGWRGWGGEWRGGRGRERDQPHRAQHVRGTEDSTRFAVAAVLDMYIVRWRRAVRLFNGRSKTASLRKRRCGSSRVLFLSWGSGGWLNSSGWSNHAVYRVRDIRGENLTPRLIFVVMNIILHQRERDRAWQSMRHMNGGVCRKFALDRSSARHREGRRLPIDGGSRTPVRFVQAC